MQDNIPDALIAAFERHYDCSWDTPALRNERLAMRYGWTAAMAAEHPAPKLDDAWKARMLDGQPLELDKHGFGFHPSLPNFDECVNGPDFFAVFGIELKASMAEDEMDSDAYEAMTSPNAVLYDCRAWTPNRPDGDGWNLVAIFDTEDGPACWWVRDKPFVPQRQEGRQERVDNAAVEVLSMNMKAKLAGQRAKGYRGWNNDCTQQRLSELLRQCVDKGDPVDVANFCAFLLARGETIAPQAAPAAVAVPANLPTGDEIRAIARSVSTSSSDSPSSSEYVMAGYCAALAATPADHIADAGKMVAPPAGWKLVPLEPTEQQLAAVRGKRHINRPDGWDSNNRRIYQAMLAALVDKSTELQSSVVDKTANLQGAAAAPVVLPEPVPTPCRSMFATQREYADAMEQHRKNWAEIEAERALLAQAATTGLPAQVVIDFEKIGTAGPFPISNGRVKLPEVTMVDLARMLKPTTDSLAQADARDAEITWPKARDVGRFDDMSPGDSIRVGLDSDNDVYVSVCGGGGVGSVEFCNPGGGGGGKSSRTRLALLALMVAMEADNAGDPARDWWAQSAAIAAARGNE